MSDNVVPLHPGNRLSPEQIERMRTQGVIAPSQPDIAALPLDPPGAEEVVIGTLNDEEAEIYVSYYMAYTEIDALRRHLSGNILRAIGDQISSGDDPHVHATHLEIEDGRAILRLHRRVELLKHMFYWQVAERFDAHEFVLGVRTGRRLVRGARKF